MDSCVNRCRRSAIFLPTSSKPKWRNSAHNSRRCVSNSTICAIRIARLQYTQLADQLGLKGQDAQTLAQSIPQILKNTQYYSAAVKAVAVASAVRWRRNGGNTGGSSAGSDAVGTVVVLFHDQVTDTPQYFSAMARRTTEPPISWLMKLALDRPQLISLAAGFTDNATLPVEEVAEITREILRRPKTAHAALQYGTTIGLPQLRHELLRRWQQQDQYRQSPIADHQ